MNITENIHFIPNVQANSYLIVEPEELTIIDTGMLFSEKRTPKYIASLGQSAAKIKDWIS